MAVVLGEDDGLGDVLAARKYLGRNAVAEGLDHRADLVFGHDVPVELAGGVGQVLFKLFPADSAGLAVAPVHPVAGLHGGSLPGYLRFDAVNVVIDVDAVGHRLPVVVLHDEVLVEETEGLLRGRGGQANQEGIEVFQRLPPQVVDRAVALVGDNEVELFYGKVRVVLHRRRAAPDLGGVKPGKLLHLRGQLLALQHGVDPLDGGDADPANRVDAPRLEQLHVVKAR